MGRCGKAQAVFLYATGYLEPGGATSLIRQDLAPGTPPLLSSEPEATCSLPPCLCYLKKNNREIFLCIPVSIKRQVTCSFPACGVEWSVFCCEWPCGEVSPFQRALWLPSSLGGAFGKKCIISLWIRIQPQPMAQGDGDFFLVANDAMCQAGSSISSLYIFPTPTYIPGPKDVTLKSTGDAKWPKECLLEYVVKPSFCKNQLLFAPMVPNL